MICVVCLQYCSKEVCDPDIGGKLVMCPQCDGCKFWTLNSTCDTSKVSSVLFQK